MPKSKHIRKGKVRRRTVVAKEAARRCAETIDVRRRELQACRRQPENLSDLSWLTSQIGIKL